MLSNNVLFGKCSWLERLEIMTSFVISYSYVCTTSQITYQKQATRFQDVYVYGFKDSLFLSEILN